jgi:hypothetical protein
MPPPLRRTTALVTDLKRLNNTVNGNPRWKVSFAIGSAITAPDVSDSYVIGDWMIGRSIDFSLDGRGRIVYIRTEH